MSWKYLGEGPGANESLVERSIDGGRLIAISTHRGIVASGGSHDEQSATRALIFIPDTPQPFRDLAREHDLGR
jgi:hypothetical protein